MLPFHCTCCGATEEHLPVSLVQHMDAGDEEWERRKKKKRKGGKGWETFNFFFFFFTYVFLVHANHDSWMFWASNNGWKDSSWSVITGETGFTHTGTVVDHEGLDFFIIIAHILFFLVVLEFFGVE